MKYVDCGFSVVRGLFIKEQRTDASGSWWIADTERGSVTEPYLRDLNATNAENTGYNIIDPH